MQLTGTPDCLVPGRMGSIRPRRTKHGGTTHVPGRAAGAGDSDDVETRKDPASRSGRARLLGEQLGINPQTLRAWVTQMDIDEGARSGRTPSEAETVARLEREDKEVRRASSSLKSASASFAAELDRPSR